MIVLLYVYLFLLIITILIIIIIITVSTHRAARLTTETSSVCYCLCVCVFNHYLRFGHRVANRTTEVRAFPCCVYCYSCCLCLTVGQYKHVRSHPAIVLMTSPGLDAEAWPPDGRCLQTVLREEDCV